LYIAEEQILIIVCASEAHESVIYCIGEHFAAVMNAQKQQDGLGEAWRLRYNLTSFYMDGSRGRFLADMTIAHEDVPLLHLEVAFTQDWDRLLVKVTRMLADDATWGVLVVRVEEIPTWTNPTRNPTHNDFMTREDWDRAVGAIQRDNPFAALRYRMMPWTHTVSCAVYFFPSTWDISDPDPTRVSSSSHIICHIIIIFSV
jgi:hypothetical protein